MECKMYEISLFGHGDCKPKIGTTRYCVLGCSSRGNSSRVTNTVVVVVVVVVEW